MLNRLPMYIKPTIFLSILFGSIFGILLNIPIIQLFMIFAFWIIGSIVVYLLKKNNFIGQVTQREAIIIGSISGMVSVFAGAITFIPLSMLLGLIFKTASTSFLFATSFMTSVFSFFVLLMLIFFIGMMNIIFNIASALLIIGIYNNINNNVQKEKQAEFKIEIDK